MSNLTYGQEVRASWWRAEGAAYQERGMSLADWVETKGYSRRTFHRNVRTFCPEMLDIFN